MQQNSLYSPQYSIQERYCLKIPLLGIFTKGTEVHFFFPDTKTLKLQEISLLLSTVCSNQAQRRRVTTIKGPIKRVYDVSESDNIKKDIFKLETPL